METKSKYTFQTMHIKALVTLFGKNPDVIEIDKSRNTAKHNQLHKKMRGTSKWRLHFQAKYCKSTQDALKLFEHGIEVL